MVRRLDQSRILIQNLKKLFAQMTIGDTKYADPTQVLRAIANDRGMATEIGDQQDIGEFNETFLSRVQEGLNYKKLFAAI